MTTILFAAGADRWIEYKGPLRKALDSLGLEYSLSPETHDPAQVDYIIYAPGPAPTDFTHFTNAKAVLSLWAGVERIVGNETLTMPLARMVNDGMTEGMVEWVVANVLRHHLGLDRYVLNPTREWAPCVPPLARDRKVAVLGLGVLGQACAKGLAGLNFDVTGWSRSQKDVAGVKCLSGDDGLEQTLTQAEILVLLLPLTPDTENLLNELRLSQMPEGAVVINPGRGPLIDDDALLAALDSGHISHATLDVFRKEPLAADHPFWSHPKVTVTPHIASDSRTESAAKIIAENIRRGEAGEPLLHLVDRGAGY